MLLLVSFEEDKKGIAPVQVLGRFNWILGLKVFVECISPTGIFELFVPSTYMSLLVKRGSVGIDEGQTCPAGLGRRKYALGGGGLVGWVR